MSIRRSRIAYCRYPGLDEFVFGTAFTDRTEHEEQAREALLKLMDSVLPLRAEVIKVVPGEIIVVDLGVAA